MSLKIFSAGSRIRAVSIGAAAAISFAALCVILFAGHDHSDGECQGCRQVEYILDFQRHSAAGVRPIVISHAISAAPRLVLPAPRTRADRGDETLVGIKIRLND
jgi:hypothetical protein